MFKPIWTATVTSEQPIQSFVDKEMIAFSANIGTYNAWAEWPISSTLNFYGQAIIQPQNNKWFGVLQTNHSYLFSKIFHPMTLVTLKKRNIYFNRNNTENMTCIFLQNNDS